MPTAWRTFPAQFRGGLTSNISPLQQGLQLPGSARNLVNFEPSIEGGYRRIEGFVKYEEEVLPSYGEVLVHGSGQVGTNLVIGNIFVTPSVGDTLTIAGVTGTYTVVAVLSFDNAGKRADLVLNTPMASSPADKAAVTFSENGKVVDFVAFFKEKALAARDGVFYESGGTGWTKISVPSHGTPLVAGAGQTGTTLNVDGLTSTPLVGETFTVAGIELVYTVTAATPVSSGASTLTIDPALSSSPADNAGVVFLTCNRSSENKVRFVRHFFTGTSKIVGVDGANKPFVYDGTTFATIDSVPSDGEGATHVAEFKNHIFLGKGSKLLFSAPYSDSDFSAGSGGGIINLPHSVTGIVVFREQLIVFSRNNIHRLVGNSVADFALQPITLDVGCVHEDTIQEVGGDIAFFAADGIRLLSATERIGDFGLAVASRPIQSEILTFVGLSQSYCSTTIREKNQYRVFGYRPAVNENSALGIIGTQFVDQSATNMGWAETRGIKAYVADSIYAGGVGEEVILFANDNGYVYQMEVGINFDGQPILASFDTPYFSMEDPTIRKTIYRLTTYINTTGAIDGTATLRYNFDEPNTIQPSPVIINNTASTVAVYGISTYGAGLYGGKLVTIFRNQVVGSGFTVSVQYRFNGSPPFSLDALTLEFMSLDKQ